MPKKTSVPHKTKQFGINVDNIKFINPKWKWFFCISLAKPGYTAGIRILGIDFWYFRKIKKKGWELYE